MAGYSTQEMFDMMFLYGRHNGNSRQAVAAYAAMYPDRRHPPRSTLNNIVKRLRETGTFSHRPRPGRPRTASNEEMETLILAAIEANPFTSSRAIATDLAISQATVLRVLKRYHERPFKAHLVHNLLDADHIPRERFCHWALERLDEDPQFLRWIFVCDESTFHRDGNVNRHNCHYWSRENPRWIRPHHFQHNFKVNVWCAMFRERIIGPVFLEANVTGQRYLQLLRNTVRNALQNLSQHERRRVWFLHDGAGPHFARAVRNELDDMFPEQWIGRGGPTHWPARSPDLTPLDFSIWGYVKEQVYTHPIATPQELQMRIRFAVGGITPNIIASIRDAWSHRLEMCTIVSGGYIEHLF
jgi:hypothetical protein